MDNFIKTKNEIRRNVKAMSYLYQTGEIDEDLFMLFVRMAMAQEISLGLENKIEKKILKDLKLLENINVKQIK